MNKRLILLVFMLLVFVVVSCTIPNNTDTNTDMQNTDTASNENNNIPQKKPLEATEEIDEYYPYVFAGRFLIDPYNTLGNYFYEIFTYEDFCASVEFPSALSAQDFVDNYVLVIMRQKYIRDEEFGLKDYNSQEQSITVANVSKFGAFDEGDVEGIKYYYLLIPRTVPSSCETNNGKVTGDLKIYYNSVESYSFGYREASEFSYENNVHIFENNTELNEFLTSNNIEKNPTLSFDSQENKLLAIYINNSLTRHLSMGESAFIGFNDLSVDENGNIEITLQRVIAGNYYGDNDKSYIYFIEIPNEKLEGYNSSFKLNLKVKDHIVLTRHPDVTYYKCAGFKDSVNIINDNGNFLVEIDYLDGSKKYVVFDGNRNVINKYNIELIDFELPSIENEISVESIKAQYGDFVTNYNAGDGGAYITKDAHIVCFVRDEDTIYALCKVDIITKDYEILWQDGV